MPKSLVRPSPPDPSKIASGKPGAVHNRRRCQVGAYPTLTSVGGGRLRQIRATGHRALHSEIKALDRVGVHPAANIFAAPMLNGLVRGEILADRDKRLPFVAHQVGRGFDLFLKHAFDFIHREISDD
jgi:hypothetical protein